MAPSFIVGTCVIAPTSIYIPHHIVVVLWVILQNGPHPTLTHLVYTHLYTDPYNTSHILHPSPELTTYCTTHLSKVQG